MVMAKTGSRGRALILRTGGMLLVALLLLGAGLLLSATWAQAHAPRAVAAPALDAGTSLTAYSGNVGTRV